MVNGSSDGTSGGSNKDGTKILFIFWYVLMHRGQRKQRQTLGFQVP